MIDPAEFGRQSARNYDRGEDVEHAVATARFIDSLAEGGAVLEVAAGTGRVACRLKTSDVTATDASDEMLSILREKSSTVKARVEILPNISGGPYSVIAILANSLWVMLTALEQRQFFNNAARTLITGGFLVVESAQVNTDSWDRPVNTPKGVREVSYDLASQRASMKFTQEDQERFVEIRWTTSDELDSWTSEAGLSLVSMNRTAKGTELRAYQLA